MRYTSSLALFSAVICLSGKSVHADAEKQAVLSEANTVTNADASTESSSPLPIFTVSIFYTASIRYI